MQGEAHRTPRWSTRRAHSELASAPANAEIDQANQAYNHKMGATAKFGAGLDDVVFYSQGSKILGGFYRGAGDGPRPTAVLLHGVPGVEKNLDIAYALRDAGWNCLYFHYRGSWGSEGNYSFSGASEDVAAATEWAMKQPSVDRDRLAVVGNSFGGYLALAATAADSRYTSAADGHPDSDANSHAGRVDHRSCRDEVCKSVFGRSR